MDDARLFKNRTLLYHFHFALFQSLRIRGHVCMCVREFVCVYDCTFVCVWIVVDAHCLATTVFRKILWIAYVCVGDSVQCRFVWTHNLLHLIVFHGTKSKKKKGTNPKKKKKMSNEQRCIGVCAQWQMTVQAVIFAITSIWEMKQ